MCIRDSFIKDILNAMKEIEEFVDRMEFDEFCNDDKTRSAVTWQLHIVGEATKNIPKEIRTKYKEIPWNDMARTRDKISRFYFGINYKIVWKVIKEELPEIKPKIEQILKELEGNL